jgi:Holliday junction resolvasome RuvABC endonuclease subunit
MSAEEKEAKYEIKIASTTSMSMPQLLTDLLAKLTSALKEKKPNQETIETVFNVLS